MSTILNLGRQIHQIDVREQGRTERTSSYIIDAENVAIIETGASPGTVYLLDALKSLGIAVQRVKYIIVTHIHLDHSGGAGQLARELPESRIIVHPRGQGILSTRQGWLPGPGSSTGSVLMNILVRFCLFPQREYIPRRMGKPWNWKKAGL